MIDKFRIKVQEKVNGQNWYIPQIQVPKWPFIPRLWRGEKWLNIIVHTNGYIETSESMQESYRTEAAALETVEKFKVYLAERRGNEVKKTTYKEL